ncbi:MAG: RNA polymerase sigma factor [Woeseiaceae bacterium]
MSQASSENLDRLVALSVRGDKVAFEKVLRYWHPRWLRFATAELSGIEAAKDAVQEASFQIARSLFRLKDPAKFRAWSFTIVRRRCKDQLRHQYRDLASIALLKTQVEVLGDTQSPDASSTRIEDAIDELPRMHQELLTLFYLYGLTMPELAGVFDVPTGTIKSRLFAVRALLRHQLEANEGGSDGTD